MNLIELNNIHKTYFLGGGVEVPVVEPKPFSYQVTFQLIGNF